MAIWRSAAVLSLLNRAASPIPRPLSRHTATALWGIFAIQPLLYLIVATLRLRERFTDPDHMRWTDPDSVYLMNGLTIADGVAPWHTEHPGTVLKALNAFVEVVVWRAGIFGADSMSLKESVVRYSENYQLLISSLLVGATTATIFFVGLRLSRYFAFPLALLAQAPPLLLITEQLPLFGSLSSHVGLGNRPESFSLLLMLLIFALIAPRFSGLKATSIQAVVLGLLLATLVSLKLSNLLALVFFPLILLNWRKIVTTYAIFIVGFFVFSAPILTRFLGFASIIQTRASWRGSFRETLQTIDEWLPQYLFENLLFLGLGAGLSITSVVLIVVKNGPKIFGKKFWTKSNLAVHFVYGIFVITSTIVAFSYVYRFDVYWAAPLVSISLYGIIVSFDSFRYIFRTKMQLSLQVIAACFLLIACSMAIIGSGYTVLSRETTPVTPSALRLAIEDTLDSGQSHLVIDYSVLWSYTPLVTRCAALLNGDSFAREVAAKEVLASCPAQSLAGFSQDGVLPLAPFVSRDPGAELVHALYCADYKKIVQQGGTLYQVTPARDFDYIKAETVVEEGGWRLSQVIDIDCANSPVRNERPNPATLAARQRISNLPVIGPIYRNWPFRDEISK